MNGTFYTRVTALLYVLAVATTVIVFWTLSHPEGRTAHFWTSFVFLLVALTLTFGYMVVRFLALSDSFRSFPVVVSTATSIFLYDLAVLAYIGLFWLAFPLSAKLYFVLHLVTFAALLFIWGVLVMFIRSAKHNESSDTRQVGRIRDLHKDVQLMQSVLVAAGEQQQEAKELARLLADLGEAIRYSDPVTHNGVADEEAALALSIASLKQQLDQYVRSPDSDALSELRGLARQALRELEARNATLKAVK